MTNTVKDIHKWNKVAGLLEKDENRELESSMLLEEVFEGLGIVDAKKHAREFVKSYKEKYKTEKVEDVNWLDHLCDLEFILHGSKAKLGLSPQEDEKSIRSIIKANMKKLTVGTDSEGKQKKPEGFVGPEKELQGLLDELNK